MSLIHNEQTKLTAAGLSTLATAFVTTGGIAPLAAWLYGIADVKLDRIWAFSLAALCIVVGMT